MNKYEDENIAVSVQQQPEEHPLGKVMTFTAEGEARSRLYSDTWDFKGTEARPKGKTAIVSFMATNPEHKKAIQETLDKMIQHHKDKTAKALTASQLRSLRGGLQHIARILCSTEWSVLDTRQGYRYFKAQLKIKELGKPTIEGEISIAINRLLTIEVLNRVRNIKELIALGKAERVKQYIAIPMGMYQQLLSQVILTVETYHPHRFEIARVMQEAYDIDARVKAGENILAGHHGAWPSSSVLSMTNPAVRKRVNKTCEVMIQHSIPDFKVALNGVQLGKIQSACAMVLAGFSGARIGEITSFEKDSYDTKIGDSGKEIAVLSGETSKGEDGKPKKATWQSHPIAKDTLELAYEMTEPLRDGYKAKIESMLENQESNSDDYQKALYEVSSVFIPSCSAHQSSTFALTGMDRRFNSLLKDFDIRATEEDVEEFNLLNPSREGTLKVGGSLPKLTPHDFRRTFAVFFKRYGFGNASGIMFQYKHKNINMSDYYANHADLMRMRDLLMDEKLLEMMNEEGINLGVDIYDDIYNGSNHLSGEGGVRIAAEDKFQKAKAGHEVYFTREQIDSLVRNGTLAAVQLPTGGYCTNGECERVCGMGLFRGEKKKCIHKINTDKTAKEVRKQRKRLIASFRGFNTGDTMRNSILVGMKQQIKELEITLVAHEINHEAFEDKVRGLII